MRRRTLVLMAFAGALVLTLAQPISATAATGAVPVTVPQSIQTTVTFESAADLGTGANQVNAYAAVANASHPTPAYWGRITPRHQSGSYGLWGMGSIPADWPSYPSDGTGGYANYSVGDTSAYYESWVQFAYIMPSLGPFDAEAFQANWYNGTKDPTKTNPDIILPTGSQFFSLSPVWTTVRFARAGSGAPIPGTLGSIQFQFKPPGGSASTGEGPTLDDLVVNGYLYGPARNVSAVRGSNPASVTVSWAKPYGALGSTTVDSRTLAYRVWRHDVTTDNWTELTSSGSRLSATTITDTNADLTDTDEYLVQAWDTGAGTGYGEPVTSSQLLPVNGTSMSTFFPAGASPLEIAYGASTKVAGTILNGSGTGVTGQAVTLQSSADGSTWGPSGASVTASATSPGTYVATVAPTSATYYRFVSTGGGGYTGCTSSPVIQLTLRASATSWNNTADVASHTVDYNGSTTMSGQLNMSEPGQTGSVIGQAAAIVVQTSTNLSTWTNTLFPVTEISPGTYRATLSSILPSTYYRFHLPSSSAYGESFSNYVTVGTRSASVLWSNVTESPLVGGNPTVPYLGSVTIAGTLANANGSATGITNIVAKYSSDNGITWTTSPATVTEISTGRYSANVQILAHTYTNPLYRVQLYFPGDSNYAQAGATQPPPTVPPVIVTKSDTAWQNLPLAPIGVASGGSVTVGADLLGTLTGRPVAGDRNGVTLWSSTDNATWTNTGYIASESPSGHYSVTLLNVTTHRYYQWRYAATNPSNQDYNNSPNSASFEVTPTASPTTSITNTFAGGGTAPLTLAIRAQQVITGALKDSGNVAIPGQASNVVVQTSSSSGGPWTNASAGVASATIEAPAGSGTYQVTVSQGSAAGVSTYYRLAFAGSGSYSASQGSSPLEITTRAANTTWSGVPSAASIGWGGSTVISGSLGGEAGPVTSTSGAFSVQTYNGATWVAASGVVSSDSPGHYTATLSGLTASAQYRLHYAGDTNYNASDSSALSVTVNAATTAWTGVSGPLSVPYGGSVALTATLQANSVPLTGKTSGITLTGSPSFSPVIAENPGGSGQYTATLSNVTASGSYQFSFAGEASHYTPAASTVIAVTMTAAKTSWTGEHLSAASVPLGGAAPTLDATLHSETGATLAGVTGSLSLQYAADAAFTAPTTVAGASFSDLGSGHYSVALPTSTSGVRYYRIYYAGSAGTYGASGSTPLSLDVGKSIASWSATSIAPTAFKAPGGNVTVQGTLRGGSSELITGAGSQVTVKWSTDGVNWNTVSAAEGPSGTYTGVVNNLTADTYVQLVYAGSAVYSAATYAYPDVISVGAVPTFANELGVPGVVGYGGGVSLGGTLRDITKQVMPGAAVALQGSWDGANWSQVSSATEDASGHYSASAGGITQTSYFRLYFPGDSQNPAGFGAVHRVVPYAYYTNLSSSSSVKHTKSLAVSGSLSQASGGRTVVIKGYHKERVRTRVKRGKKYVYVYVNKWVLRTSASVGVPAGGGIFRYSKSIKLSRTGSWYLQAFVSDGYTMPIATAQRSVKSK